MSVNLYNAETNELELLAGASEIPRWSGTQAEFNALNKNSLAEGTIIEITDDLSNIFSTWTGTSAEFEALDKSTLADGCYINITDDETNTFEEELLWDGGTKAGLMIYREGRKRTIVSFGSPSNQISQGALLLQEKDRPLFAVRVTTEGAWTSGSWGSIYTFGVLEDGTVNIQGGNGNYTWCKPRTINMTYWVN